ncbi:MAG: T9SS type A sorting domain-containing protein [candidate division Zixibacteria bacterium]|nr:T9SS type A sorting domain-containing protein [Gammaproteobacteria bacterium]NIX55522.1 T9SS type A sorting domain-containing protein [candidate division Zixibacteria bacterium]
MTGIQQTSSMPTVFFLHQNYPNPFNPTTTIRIDLPHAAKVKLEIFNILGQRVAILLNEHKPAGHHEVKFDGREFASGVYFYRIQTTEFTAIKKMLLMQ